MKDINYRKLEGLESKDKWGNKTKIIDVDTDIITIATYRGKDYDSCITRKIWRDDYYLYPSLYGGYKRMKKELELCGFDLDELKQNIYMSYEEVNREQTQKIKECLPTNFNIPNTFA